MKVSIKKLKILKQLSTLLSTLNLLRRQMELNIAATIQLIASAIFFNVIKTNPSIIYLLY